MCDVTVAQMNIPQLLRQHWYRGGDIHRRPPPTYLRGCHNANGAYWTMDKQQRRQFTQKKMYESPNHILPAKNKLMERTLGAAYEVILKKFTIRADEYQEYQKPTTN